MPDRNLRVDVLSPDRSVWSGTASSVRAPGLEGSFGVLPRHIGLVSALGTGTLRVREAGGERVFAVSGGFLEVGAEGGLTRVKVLSDSAEPSQEIDLVRAQASKRRAQERLASANKDLDPVRAQASLARALNRLKLGENKG